MEEKKELKLESNSTSTATKKYWLNSYLVSLAVLLSGGMIAWAIVYSSVIKNNGQTGQAAEAQVADDTNGLDPNKKVEVGTGKAEMLGQASAPVTIIEFSDFQCPYCKKFVDETFPELKKQYIDTGKVKMYFRQFPLEFHDNAEGAAQATLCARDGGKFWQMHDKIFAQQTAIDKESLKKYAADLGVGIGDCLDTEKYKLEVKNDIEEATKIGVDGTPAFFINGRALIGAQPLSEFVKIIEEELKK